MNVIKLKHSIHDWPRSPHPHHEAFFRKSLDAFMNVTGLVPAKMQKRFLHDEIPWAYPAGFDHIQLWRHPEMRRHLLTNEPYNATAVAEETCKRRGWEYAVIPPGRGLWFPTGPNGTHLMLISPGEAGVDLGPLVAPLMEALPKWNDETLERSAA